MITRGWTSLADINSQPPPPPSQTPVRDLARNAAAAAARGNAMADDMALNPDQMVIRPALTLGSAAYNWLAPKLGGQPMSEDFRKFLTEPEKGAVSQAVQSVGKATGTDPYAVVPKTPVEANLATVIEGAYPGMVFGAAGGPVGAVRGGLLGGTGAEAGTQAAQLVDPKYRDAVEMLTNMATQGVGAMALKPYGRNIDASTAQIAQTGRDQGIPFSAPDITPGSLMRTPESVQATSDALQGNIIRDLGADPDTGVRATTNRFTPPLMTQVRQDTSNGFQTLANNNDINPQETLGLLRRLQAIENQTPNMTGVSPADPGIVRQRIADIRNAVDPKTGTISGQNFYNLTNTGSFLDELTRDSNPGVARLGGSILDATRDAFQNSLSPADAATNQALRYRWRLMNAVEPQAAWQRGQSLDMGQLAQSIRDQSQHFDLGNRSMAYTGGGQLGDYMSQARLIAEGPQPQGGSVLGPLATPQGITTMALAHSPAAAAAPIIPRMIEKAVGPYARSNPRTDQLIAAAMDPATRLRQALATLMPASGP